MVHGGLAKSRGEARRLIEQGGVRINGDKVGTRDDRARSRATSLQAGKRRFDSNSREVKCGESMFGGAWLS